ncbi:type IV secretion system protein VirB10 [Shewanella oncorhynchi]|uniref:type IV secretion system protein VirB10 n=1 Tax=Shewanella oncorhynchi TaxID=2726434 RepID=UPI003D7AECEF
MTQLTSLPGEDTEIVNPSERQAPNKIAVALFFGAMMLVICAIGYFYIFKPKPEAVTTNVYREPEQPQVVAIPENIKSTAQTEAKNFNIEPKVTDFYVQEKQSQIAAIPRPAPKITIDKSRSPLSNSNQGGQSQKVTTLPTGQSDPALDFYREQIKAMQASSQPATTPNAPSLQESLSGTATPSATATLLSNRNFLLTKGTFIDCALNTALNSSVAGMTKCTLTRHVYSDNGKVLLLERGSTVTGEYRANLAQGQTRLFVLWDRVKTPNGVAVDLSSPSTDPLGGSGADGYIDSHFWKRYGGAMMLSLVDDFAAYASSSSGESTIKMENSSQAAQNAATEALKNTINIPPTLRKNQGDRIGIFVARDIDFSNVYKLSVQ